MSTKFIKNSSVFHTVYIVFNCKIIIYFSLLFPIHFSNVDVFILSPFLSVSVATIKKSNFCFHLRQASDVLTLSSKFSSFGRDTFAPRTLLTFALL